MTLFPYHIKKSEVWNNNHALSGKRQQKIVIPEKRLLRPEYEQSLSSRYSVQREKFTLASYFFHIVAMPKNRATHTKSRPPSITRVKKVQNYFLVKERNLTKVGYIVEVR